MERLRANQPLTIYLVDDEAAVRSLLTRVLQQNGFETQCFGTADEARMAITRAGLTRDPVDVVLLDMLLESGTDSTGSAEDLLEMVTRRQPSPGVVVMSAHLSSDEFFRLILKGATDFVSKPWETNELLKRVRDCGIAGRQKYRHYHSLGTPLSRVQRDAFLSYSSRNTDLALGLKRVLERMGVSTWYAPADLPPGEHWPNTLDAAIDKCSVFLALLTPDAVESDHVIREVTKALSRKDIEGDGFLLVPVAYGVPPMSVPERLRALQAVDLTDEHSFVDNLIRLADRVTQFVESRVVPGSIQQAPRRPASRARAEKSLAPDS